MSPLIAHPQVIKDLWYIYTVEGWLPPPDGYVLECEVYERRLRHRQNGNDWLRLGDELWRAWHETKAYQDS